MNSTQLIPTIVLTTLCLCAARCAETHAELDIVLDHDGVTEHHALALADVTADVKREVERNLQQVDRQVKIAQAQASHALPMLKRAIGATYVNQMEPPLIVSTEPLDAAALAELREDLTVMSKLVSDALAGNRDEASVHRAMGIVVNWLPGGTTSENLYVEGHGVILQTTVRFPLAPAKKEETTKPAEAPKNSAWETARRELFGGENEESEVLFPPERREEYDADRVEALKKDLLKALANASNFRRLDGDETVSAVVRSRTGSRSQIVVFKSSDGVNKTQTNSNDTDSTLTIRVKKSDADALASGSISEDEFRKRAKVAIY